jgi:predicted small lipoprotein YifL
MTRTILLMTLSMALVACGKSSAPESADAAAPAEAPASATASAGGDICALIEDPDTLFGQPVTAAAHDGPNGLNACEWKNAEGRLCGMVTPMGSGWYAVPSLEQGFKGMVTSMGAFGKTYAVAGIGEEAAAVDGGMLGAQMAIRTSRAIANIGAACGGSGPANLEHAEKIARAIAPKL